MTFPTPVVKSDKPENFQRVNSYCLKLRVCDIFEQRERGGEREKGIDLGSRA